MPIPLSNPYANSTSPRTKVSANISAYDHALIERLFPHAHGLQDRIVATLYHDLCTRLRDALVLPTDTFNPPDSAVAWHIEHPSWSLLRGLLRSTAGQSDDGATSPRDDTGAVGGVYQGVQSEETECGGAENVTLTRGDSPRRSEETQEEGQRGTGDGTPEPTGKKLKGLMDLLKNLKE